MINLLGLKLHAYGFLIGIGVVLAWEVANRLKRIESKKLERLLVLLLLFGVIGARVYHVIDFWEYYTVNLKEIFYLWNGGLGIWGALVGGAMGIGLYCRKEKAKFWEVFDAIVVGVPLAQAVGRMGNWANGELYGKNGEPLFAWEGGLNLILFVILWKLAQKKQPTGTLSGVYLAGYGMIRIFLENFREDGIIWKVGGIPTAIIFGTASVLLGATLIMKNQKL